MPDDYESTLRQNWFRRQIEKGLMSPDAGELTRARIDELIEDGIARAKKKIQPKKNLICHPGEYRVSDAREGDPGGETDLVLEGHG
jgi:hypothetical protein